MSSEPEWPAVPPTQRRRKQSPPRRNEVKIRLSDAEYRVLAERAAAVGRTITGYVAERGLEPLHPRPVRHGGLAPGQLRALIAETYALRRILTGARTNLAQLGGHAEDDTAAALGEHLARVEVSLPALDDLLEDLMERVDF